MIFRGRQRRSSEPQNRFSSKRVNQYLADRRLTHRLAGAHGGARVADQAWVQRHLGQRYRDYLRALPNQEWYSAFRQHCELTKRIAENLQGTTRGAMDTACRAAGYEGGADAYVEAAWYERRNGVSSLMQGGITRDTFDKAKESDQFWTVVGLAISAANPRQRPELAAVSAAYEQAIDWMSQFASEHGTSRFPAIVNRFFAGCLPGKLTTVAAEYHFSALLMSMDVGEIRELRGNWLHNNWVLMEWLSAALAGQAIDHDDEYQRSIFFWWLYENLAGFEDRQVIYFGSPGTGKTWKAVQVGQARIKSWRRQYDSSAETRSRIGEQLVRVQFHPSYGYEDFIEGIRPVGTSEGRIQLSLRDGIFKHFCRRAAQWEINFVQSTGIDISDQTTVGDAYDHCRDLDAALWSFLSDGLPRSDRVIDHLPPYFLIIDEINRAELSRVMGELMFSLEYRGSANKLRTQYSELVKDEHDDSAFLFDRSSSTNYFFVPHNLYLYGTMNTIDRSVESFDFALRRRFRWEELTFDQAAAHEILEASGVNKQASESIVAALDRLNGSISGDKFLGPDYCVGHAYLKHMVEYRGPKASRAYLEFLWHTRLDPLLREYFRGSASPSNLYARVDALRNSFFG